MKPIIAVISLWTLTVTFLVECIILGFKRRFGLDLTMTSLTFTFLVLSHVIVLATNLRQSKIKSTKWRIALYFIAFQIGFIGLIICLVTNANIINGVWIIMTYFSPFYLGTTACSGQMLLKNDQSTIIPPKIHSVASTLILTLPCKF